MTTTTDVHGPVDFVLLEFPRDGLTGEASRALMDLVERGIVRLYDLLVISKDQNGAVEVLELTDPGSGAGSFAYRERQRRADGRPESRQSGGACRAGPQAG